MKRRLLMHPRAWLCTALLASGSLVAGGAHGLETSSVSGPVQVRVELTPDSPVIGDPMVLRIEALAEAGVEILMPAFGEAPVSYTHLTLPTKA